MGESEKMNIDNQAELISGFLGISLKNAKDRLSLGFHANHHEVAKDFIDNNTNVDDPNLNGENLRRVYMNLDVIFKNNIGCPPPSLQQR